MFNTKFKSKASRNREVRENLSIIMASQRSKIFTPPERSLFQMNMKNGSCPSTPKSSFERVTISNVPQLVTAAQSRASQSGRINNSSLRVTDGWISSCVSSQPVVRTPNQPIIPGFFSSRNPTTSKPFLSKYVKRPPDTPKPSHFDSGQGTNNEILLQSPWVQRCGLNTNQVKATTKYSIKELIDILCGDAQEIPDELELIGKRIHFIEGKSVDNNEAIALGKTPRRLRNTNIKGTTLLPLFDNFATASVVPNTKLKPGMGFISDKTVDFTEFGFGNLDMSSISENLQGDFRDTTNLPAPVPIVGNEFNDTFVSPLDFGFSKLAQKRKVVSFNDTVEFSSLSSILPKTPLHETTNHQFCPSFTPIWEQDSIEPKRRKESGGLLTSSPNKLSFSEECHLHNVNSVDIFSEQVFSPTRFPSETFSSSEVCAYSFHEEEAPITSTIVTPNETRAMTRPKSAIDIIQNSTTGMLGNHMISPTNSGSSHNSHLPGSSPLTTRSPHFSLGDGHGLDFIQQMYRSDDSPSQPFSISW